MIGKCLCGEVQFELCGDIPNLYQCHCSLCRKQGGSSANAATIIHESQFSWKSGEGHISYFKKDTGFSSDFCSHCGSPVPNRLRDTALYWIPAGLLEDDDELEVVAHLYTHSKASWEEIPNSGQQFEEMPSLDALVRALQRTT